MARLVLCGGLLSLVCACPGGDGDASASVTRALIVYVEAYCDAVFNCVSGEQLDQNDWRISFQDEATCVRVLTRYVQSEASYEVQRFRELEAAGKLVVDRSRFEACRELGRSCSAPARRCLDMLDGTVPSGGTCALDDECEGDARCVPNSAVDACVTGTCQALVPIGGACRFAKECQPGSAGTRVCGGMATAQGGRCMETEVSVARAGEACGRDFGADVTRLVTCERGFWCDSPADETGAGLLGTCRAPLALGAACDENNDVCETGGACVLDGTEQRCKKITLSRAGEPCRDSTVFALCDVYAGFTCGEGNQCVALGDGTQGSRCDVTDRGQLVPCNLGLYCAAVSHTCEPLKDVDQSCEEDSDCASHHCDQGTQTCQVDVCDDIVTAPAKGG